jgi:hypothetical protein
MRLIPIGGILVVPDATIIAHRDLFILFAARYRLPASILGRYFVTVGALMSCGIDNIDVLHKAVPMSIASCALQSLSKRL